VLLFPKERGLFLRSDGMWTRQALLGGSRDGTHRDIKPPRVAILTNHVLLTLSLYGPYISITRRDPQCRELIANCFIVDN
jgi:hypothetical protein